MDNVRMEYFTAVWCGPCRSMVTPIAELQAEGWNIEKIDTDQNRAKAAEAQIMGIPTFVIYRDGVAVRRFTGARNKAGLLAELNLAAG